MTPLGTLATAALALIAFLALSATASLLDAAFGPGAKWCIVAAALLCVGWETSR